MPWLEEGKLGCQAGRRLVRHGHHHRWLHREEGHVAGAPPNQGGRVEEVPHHEGRKILAGDPGKGRRTQGGELVPLLLRHALEVVLSLLALGDLVGIEDSYRNLPPGNEHDSGIALHGIVATGVGDEDIALVDVALYPSHDHAAPQLLVGDSSKDLQFPEVTVGLLDFRGRFSLVSLGWTHTGFRSVSLVAATSGVDSLLDSKASLWLLVAACSLS
jgi:hypothetical protein